MNNLPHYQRLKDLVEADRLRAHIIIAPPRTNSTLVEHSLGNSPDIQHECHEPFLNARHEGFDPDHGYRQIYDSIGGDQFEQSDEQTSVVIKDMAHWIGKNEEYKRLVELSTDPIIVLIRNPLLSVESRIRRVLSTMDMRYSINLQRYLLDDIAAEKDFRSWADLADAVRSGIYTEPLDFLEHGESVERLYEIPILETQNHLLDLRARKNGYTNWRDLVEQKLYIERDYAFFDGILQSSVRRLGFEREEFKGLADEVAYFERQGKDYIVLDTTDLRAAPEKQTRELCTRLDIRFSPEMLQWGRAPVDFHTEQTEQFERLWYDTLFSSSGINPPTEIPPVLAMFPDFVREYLQAENLPIYVELSQKKIIGDELRHELNEREFEVKVTVGNKAQLRTLGLAEDAVELGETVRVKLKHIDPIYATTNEPRLIDYPEFARWKEVYASELRIVSDVISEIEERAREVKNQKRETKFRSDKPR